MKKRTLSNPMFVVGIFALIVLLIENWVIGLAVFLMMWSNNCGINMEVINEYKEK